MNAHEYELHEAAAECREHRSAQAAKILGLPTASVECGRYEHVNVNDPTQRRTNTKGTAVEHHRKCWDCGNIAMHADSIVPHCLCKKCGSQDTRLVRMQQVKCNKCGHVAPESEFPKGRDFCQQSYIASCPKCDNRQSPGDASMRMFGGERPFVFVRADEPAVSGPAIGDALPTVLHRAGEAS